MSCCAVDPAAASSKSAGAVDTRWLRFDLVALVAAGFVAGNSTLFALVVNLAEMPPATRFVFHTGLLASSLLVAGLLSPVLLKAIRANVGRRSVAVDVLFLLGCLGALGVSLISYRRGFGPVYFEVVSILLVIYTFGTRIKAATQRRVWASLEAWSPTSHRCRVLDREHRVQLRPVSEVAPGDRVLVPAGGMVPIDGRITSGRGFVRESTITGEPHLRRCGPGDPIFASSLVVDSPLQVEANRRGDERVIDSISAAIARAIDTPSRWQSQADRIARWFTPLVAAVSLATLAAWWWTTDLPNAIFVSLSVLLVACPCAFGFATPVSIWVTLSRMSSRGLAVQRSDVIERLAEVDTVVFDKTGTLTVPEPGLKRLMLRDETRWPQSEVMRIARSVQAASGHPIASAFLETDRESAMLPAHGTEPIPGTGVRGFLERDGHRLEVEIGRLGELHRPCCDGEWIASVRHEWECGGQPLAIRIDGTLAAIAVVDERPLDTLAAGLAELRRLGLETYLYSGDRGERVTRLGIPESQGALSPEDKADRVSRLRRRGRRVLFVGDGVNDAAAMAAADVSLAVASGSELTADAADFVWHGGDMGSIPAAWTTARRAVGRLRSALRFAVSYNMLGMAIAAAGWLHPVAAALLMMSSSLWVTLRAADIGAADTAL